MIKTELALAGMQREEKLLKNKDGVYLIHKYLYRNCHYLSKALGEYLRVDKITIFFLSKSNIIVHSAIEIDEFTVLDILGNRTKQEIIDLYDTHNSLFGRYEIDGSCKSTSININNFNYKEFYEEDTYDKSLILEETKKWFKDLEDKRS